MEGFEDSAVYAVRPSQVIRVDDQILHDLYGSLVAPVRLDSYSFARPPKSVPLTVFAFNSSMAW
jgi:hypothetical protein